MKGQEDSNISEKMPIKKQNGSQRRNKKTKSLKGHQQVNNLADLSTGGPESPV
jgi:hypothetical protein